MIFGVSESHLGYEVCIKVGESMCSPMEEVFELGRVTATILQMGKMVAAVAREARFLPFNVHAFTM